MFHELQQQIQHLRAAFEQSGNHRNSGNYGLDPLRGEEETLHQLSKRESELS